VAVNLLPAGFQSGIKLVSPFKGFLSSPVSSGIGGGRKHSGEDIPLPRGTAIRAPMDGIVRVYENDRGGKQVILQMANGDRFGVAHLDAQNVRDGQQVSAGTVLGKSGNTGKSTGPHGHFTVTSGGRKVSPRAYFKKLVGPK
jgi:murein DD-endopeptidase MepM/ murein hydrolase activator NlpD